MSKYQDIMNKIEVTDEMKSRILQNIEKEFPPEDVKEEGAGKSVSEDKRSEGTGKSADSGSGAENSSNKIRKFDFRQYMPMAAALAVFVLSTYLILNVIPHKQAATSTAPMSDSAVMYEATETESATEAPMVAEEAMETESAAEAPAAAEEAMPAEEAMEAEMVDEAAVEEAAEVQMATESAVENAAVATGEAAKDADKSGKTPQAPMDNATLTGGAKTEITAPASTGDKTEPALDDQINSAQNPDVSQPMADSKPGLLHRIASFFKKLIEAIKGWFK